jgi:hypothetical protein
MAIELSVNTWVSGISACLILFTGYATALGCFRQVKKTNNNLLWYAGMFLACMGSFYLGTVSSFFSLLIMGKNLPTAIVGQLCYVWVPVGTALTMYIGFMILNPKWAKPLAFIYIISGFLFWYGLFIISDITIEATIPEEGKGLIDIQLRSIVQLMVALYMASFAIAMIGGFSWLYRKSSGTIKKKAGYHMVGYSLFVVCGILDSMAEFPNAFYLMVVRLIMVVGYFFMYLGFTSGDV